MATEEHEHGRSDLLNNNTPPSAGTVVLCLFAELLATLGGPPPDRRPLASVGVARPRSPQRDSPVGPANRAPGQPRSGRRRPSSWCRSGVRRDRTSRGRPPSRPSAAHRASAGTRARGAAAAAGMAKGSPPDWWLDPLRRQSTRPPTRLEAQPECMWRWFPSHLLISVGFVPLSFGLAADLFGP